MWIQHRPQWNSWRLPQTSRSFLMSIVDSPKWFPITLVCSINSILAALSPMMALHIGRSNVCFNVSSDGINSSLPATVESMEFNTFLAATFSTERLTTTIHNIWTMGGYSVHAFSRSLELLNDMQKLEIFQCIDNISISPLASLENSRWVPICQYPTCSRSLVNLIDITVSLWISHGIDYYLCDFLALNSKATTILSQNTHERNKKNT